MLIPFPTNASMIIVLTFLQGRCRGKRYICCDTVDTQTCAKDWRNLDVWSWFWFWHLTCGDMRCYNLSGEMLRQAMLMWCHWAVETHTVVFCPGEDLARHEIDFMTRANIMLTILTRWYQGLWPLRLGLADMRDDDTRNIDAPILYAEALVVRSIADLALKLACKFLITCASPNICFLLLRILWWRIVPDFFNHKCFSFRPPLHYCYASCSDELCMTGSITNASPSVLPIITATRLDVTNCAWLIQSQILLLQSSRSLLLRILLWRIVHDWITNTFPSIIRCLSVTHLVVKNCAWLVQSQMWDAPRYDEMCASGTNTDLACSSDHPSTSVSSAYPLFTRL